MDTDPERTVADDVESVAPDRAHGSAPVDSRPVSGSHEGEAKQAFYRMMNEWFSQFIQNNPAVHQPPPPNNPTPIPSAPPMIDPVRSSRPPVDKIRKFGAEEFKANDDDDAERAEMWLDNTIRVLDELSCTPDECLKCAISLLRDTAYHWWNTLVSVVPKEKSDVRFLSA